MGSIRQGLRQNDPRGTLTLGAGQLSLIEHALCPLDTRQAARAGQVHESQYQYTDRSGMRRTAQVRVICPLGLSANDEFFLWGLLALTLSQPGANTEFHATPHYCLRQLGVIDQHARRGGRQYDQFARSLERLSSVTYQNDGFYDPVRREHRRVGFGFLSYSLPLSPESSLAWRIAWDAVFFEFAAAVGGSLRFDLALYRQLDPASRRLFLFVSKLLRRRERTPPFDLKFLGQHVLGFAPSLATRDLKAKVKRCVERLAEQQVVALAADRPPIHSGRGGIDVVQLTRGPNCGRGHAAKSAPTSGDSPLADLMRQIGLSQRTIARCVTQFSTALLQQWLDITLAARERHGASFFRKSAAAYFIDNVQNAAQGKRTPPDWWHDLLRAERRRQAESCRQERTPKAVVGADNSAAALTAAVTRQFRSAGQSAEDAAANAQRFVDSCGKQTGNPVPASFLRILT